METLIANRTMEKGYLTKVMARVEASVVTQRAVIVEVAVLTHKRFLAYERDMRLMGGAVQKVQISIAQPVEMDDRFDAPTLWGSTSFIADEVL